MLHLLRFSYNGEPPKRLVTEEPITPSPLFFVRNHGGIPEISEADYTLRLDGLVAQPTSPQVGPTCGTKTCFPVSRTWSPFNAVALDASSKLTSTPEKVTEMIKAPWAEGAIGTATWTGVSLKKVIKPLRRSDRRCAASRSPRCRYVLQADIPISSSCLDWIGGADESQGPGAELLGIGSLVKGQSQRGHPCMGDEWPAASERSTGSPSERSC